jgi:hypothetical protein
MEAVMTEDPTRLNIERAREALARARADQVAAAVRAPRPADLSRLQENDARRQAIDTRAGAFRSQLRDQLGLGEYRGPHTPTSSYVSKMISAPLCDADVCAPARPALKDTASAEETPAAPPRPQDDEIELQGEVIELEGETPSAPEAETELSAVEPPAEAPVKINEVTSDPILEPAPKKRKKFLGIF